MDFEALLKKYMAYVTACEGIDFVEGGYRGYSDDPKFTPEEWAELDRLSRENDEAV